MITPIYLVELEVLETNQDDPTYPKRRQITAGSFLDKGAADVFAGTHGGKVREIAALNFTLEEMQHYLADPTHAFSELSHIRTTLAEAHAERQAVLNAVPEALLHRRPSSLPLRPDDV